MSVQLFIELARSRLVVEAKLQEVLDTLVPPTSTGYLHRDESWTIAWVRNGEGSGDIEAAFDPPEGAHEWRHPHVKRLQRLQDQLGCDRVYAFALEADKVRYIATWDKKGTEL